MAAKVLVSMSGGLDSGVLLAYVLKHSEFTPVAANFVYPSKHNEFEHKAFLDLCDHFKIKNRTIDVTAVFDGFSSALLQSGSDIPEGHYEDDNMSKTVVPGRNLIFGAVLAGLAESIGARSVYLAVHSGDHHIYPDCRPIFVENFNRTVQCSSDNKVNVMTPFLHLPKNEIVRIGLEMEFPFHLTRTCYKAQPVACGVCGSCFERQEAFYKNNTIDPLEYEQPLDVFSL